MTEEYISRKGKTLGAARQITLLGAIQVKKQAFPSLLYVVTWDREDEAIENVSQIGACILSNSRKVFLGRVNVLLQALDDKKSELLYMDTGERDRERKRKLALTHFCLRRLCPRVPQRADLGGLHEKVAAGRRRPARPGSLSKVNHGGLGKRAAAGWTV
jgi:hypothetical protein